jgi:very-short-patch-repair endonuclease
VVSIGDPWLVTHPVPSELKTGPITVSEAAAAGVPWGRLRGSSYSSLGAGVYRWAELELSAWLHGLDVKPCDPIEVTLPDPLGTRRLSGAAVRRSLLNPAEIVTRRGLPATSALRTVIDLAGREPLTEGVVAADLFLHARRVTHAQLQAYVADHPRTRGVARVRRVAELAEPKTESAMETRLRMLFILSGLPRPEVQVPIRDGSGRLLGRADLLYREARLAIEYDGVNHKERLLADNRRQNRILEAGYRLLRFAAADVYRTPEATVAQVRAALDRLTDQRTSVSFGANSVMNVSSASRRRGRF